MAVLHLFNAVGKNHKPAIDLIEFAALKLMSELFATQSQRVAAGVLAQHQSRIGHAHRLWGHDFVGQRILEHAILVNSSRNAFAHEAGIHQDGMLKNPLTYEIMTPQSVGVPDSRLVLGKHSGRHALALRCEQLGHQFERRELDEIYRRFVVLADRIKKVQDSHLLELIQDVSSGNVSSSDVTGGKGKKFAPAAATLQVPRAVSAAARAHASDSHPAHVSGSAGQASLSIPFTDHHSEQADYLWGV